MIDPKNPKADMLWGPLEGEKIVRDTRTKDELFEDLCKKIDPRVMDMLEEIIKEEIKKRI